MPSESNKKTSRSSSSRSPKKKKSREVESEEVMNEHVNADPVSEKAELEKEELESFSPSRETHPERGMDREEEFFDEEENSEEQDSPTSAEAPTRPSQEFSNYVYWDRGARQYVAGFFEFPDLRASSGTRAQALAAAEEKLESHLQNLRKNSQSVPESFALKRYPDVLEVRLSQTLFRRLDLMSRMERVSLDSLVTEILSAATEKRRSTSLRNPGPQQQPPRPMHGHGQHANRDRGRERDRDRDRDRDPDNVGNRVQPMGGQNRGGNRPPQGGHRRDHQRRNSQKVMESGESFMEYVRNLEKNKWNKR